MAAANLIGLDIGSMSIRAVETGRSKDGPMIVNFGHAPLPEGAVLGGVVQDAPAVTRALKRLWDNTAFRSRKVALGVTNPQVVVREMEVSNLPREALRKALPFQVRDALPLPVDRSLLDFYPLEDAGDREMVRGLLIAAPKEAVLAAVHAIEGAGLHVARVDLAAFALLRSASVLDRRVEAIIDIGARATSVIVHADGAPLIVRTIPRGGAEITQAIAKRLDISAEDAETLKCRVGVLVDRGADTAQVVRDAVQPLMSEIRSSFAYLTSGERQRQVTRLALSGGGSLLPGLLEALAIDLNIEVVMADPTMRLTGSRRFNGNHLEHFRSSVAVSIGLTLGAA
jgi:type IV pilus assembly protein PilM